MRKYFIHIILNLTFLIHFAFRKILVVSLVEPSTLYNLLLKMQSMIQPDATF
jgi:hypothetical protein